MLQTIRDKSQGIIALLIIVFVCITFALWGIHNYFNASSDTKPVAKVNGQKITEQEFNADFTRFRQQQMQQNPDIFSSQSAVDAAKSQLLDSLITSILQTQDANKNGFGVGQELMELELANMPIFQENGMFSKLRFQQILSNMMFTQDQFFMMLRDSMVLAQVRAGFVAPAFVLPNQVDYAIRLINEKRSFQYVIVPASRFENQSTVSDAAVAQYYQSHQSEFSLPRKVSLQYISLSLPDLMKKVQPTDSDLMQYYQDNINHYTIAKQWNLAHILVAVAPDATPAQVSAAEQKAQSLYAKLQAGQPFAGVALQSDDAATARNAGKLPMVNFLQLDSSWQQQLISLKDGQVTAPFKTPQGYEIVKVLTTVPAVVQPYAQVQAKVKADYIQQTAEKNFASLSDQLSNITFENPDSLDSASKQLNLPIQTTALFSEQGGEDDLTKNPKVIAAAFSNEVLNQGTNSDVIPVTDTQAVVVRVDQKVAASVKPLAQVRQDIIATLKLQYAADQAKALANKIETGLEKNVSLQALAASNQLQVQSVQMAARNNNKQVNSNLVHAAFGLNVPSAKQVAVTIIPLVNGDSALVQLTAVQNGDSASVPDSVKKYYYAGMAKSAGELDYALYVNGLKQSADIKYYKTDVSPNAS